MKKLLSALIICFCFLLTGCVNKQDNLSALEKIQQRDKIIVGVKYDTKPFGYLDEKQELQGYDIDLAKKIAKYLLGDESKVEFKQVTPSSRILALNSGQIDMAIATMTITPQRKEVVDFSIPYYFAGQSILVPQDSTIKSISDLNGKKVIIVFGSTAEKNVRLNAPDALIRGYKTYTEAYSALKKHRADAITSDDTILIGFAMQDKGLKLLPKRYSKEPYGIAFKKGTASESLKEKVDFVLKDLKEKGELNQLKAKWIKY